jgi:hypothetical protein
MYYTPLANYSVSENNPIRASVRPPKMSDMTAISPTTGELMVPGNAGVVIQAKSGDNAIRVSGTATSTAGLVSNGTTANQIQFYSNGDITAAFDSRGLYLVDNDWINIGSGKIVIYTGAGNYTGNLVIGSSLSGTKLTGTGISGMYNTFLGYGTGVENTTGHMNTFVGYGAGQFISTGAGNVCVGCNAGQNQLVGNNNTYIGQNAGINDNGLASVYIGASAGGGSSTITGSFNQCIGVLTGTGLTTGFNNTFIGKDAGRTCTTGNSNIIIGNYSDVSSASVANEIIIGGGKVGKGSNTTYITGNFVHLDGIITNNTQNTGFLTGGTTYDLGMPGPGVYLLSISNVSIPSSSNSAVLFHIVWGGYTAATGVINTLGSNIYSLTYGSGGVGTVRVTVAGAGDRIYYNFIRLNSI